MTAAYCGHASEFPRGHGNWRFRMGAKRPRGDIFTNPACCFT
jgi:hypothetical protein